MKTTLRRSTIMVWRSRLLSQCLHLQSRASVAPQHQQHPLPPTIIQQPLKILRSRSTLSGLLKCISIVPSMGYSTTTTMYVSTDAPLTYHQRYLRTTILELYYAVLYVLHAFHLSHYRIVFRSLCYMS